MCFLPFKSAKNRGVPRIAVTFHIHRIYASKSTAIYSRKNVSIIKINGKKSILMQSGINVQMDNSSRLIECMHFYMVFYSLGPECMHFYMVLYSLGPECMHFYMVLYSLGPECMHFYMVLYSLGPECMYFYMVLYSLGARMYIFLHGI